jgi:hypothetical protein
MSRFWTSAFSVANPVAPGGGAVEVQAAAGVVGLLQDQVPQRVEVVAGVVEDHIDQEREAAAVSGVDQPAEVVGAAEVALDGVVQRRVVAE